MNKRLEKEVGEQLAEKRGWPWALTSFIMEIRGNELRILKIDKKGEIIFLVVCFTCYGLGSGGSTRILSKYTSLL